MRLDFSRLAKRAAKSDDRFMFVRIYQWVHSLLHQPIKILWFCLALAGLGVLLDGSAFRLWSLNRDHRMLTQEIGRAKSRSQQLGYRIQMAQKPEFIEKAARDQFDLVKEGDLIFIFADDTPEAADRVSKKPDPKTDGE